MLANFEVVLKNRKNSFFKSSSVRGGVGGWGTYDDYGLVVFSMLSSLTGERNHHFEFGIGGAYLSYAEFSYNYNTGNKILPAANVGYRFQKPERNFLFRTGIGFPDAIYIGVGLSIK